MEYICTKCEESKPESEYFFREKGYRRKQCKTCVYKCNRKNYDHEKERFRKLENAYSISKQDFNVLMVKQNGLCAICQNPPVKHTRNRGVLCVDHDHKTNKVRGLLCRPCNQGLGLLKDNTKLLNQAIQYLNQYS